MDPTYAAAYLFLVLATLACVGTIVIGSRLMRSPEFVLMPALTYYYTLFGAWQILRLKAEGETSDALYHLEASLVAVQIDADYVASLSVYGLFLLLLWLGLVAGARRIDPPTGGDLHRFRVLRLVAVALVAMAASAWALWTELQSALQQGVSLYLLIRGEAVPLFPVHQLLNRIGLAALALAWVGQLREPGGALAAPARALLLTVATGAWVTYLGALGNRNEIVLASLGGLYLFALLGGRVRAGVLLSVAAIAYVALRSIETLRAQPLEAMLPALLEAMTTIEFWDPSAVAGGSESLAAHVSLYGLMASSAPWTHGSSLVYLIQSLIPFLPGEARVADSYQLYARAVGAPDSQGFNIHFAAGAWLNGGLVAMVGFTMLLVALFRTLRGWARANARHPARALPFLAGYAFLCAMVPVAMRAGPEGLKALFFEGFALPFLVAWIGSLAIPQIRAKRRPVSLQKRMV